MKNKYRLTYKDFTFFGTLAFILTITFTNVFAIPLGGSPQTITWISGGPFTVGTNFDVSGLAIDSPAIAPVTFSVGDEGSVCTVTSAGLVHPMQTGLCRITAFQPSFFNQDTNTTIAAAAPVSTSFLIIPPLPIIPIMPIIPVFQSQTINFTQPADKIVGDAPFQLTANSSSGLPISYSTSNEACSVTMLGLVTILSAGSCTISTIQGGNGIYLPAQIVSRTFTITAAPVIEKQHQTITFTTLDDQTLDPNIDDPQVQLVATSTSGLFPTFTATGACQMLGESIITLESIGVCAVTALQAGNAIFAPAPDVTQFVGVRDNDGVSSQVEDNAPNMGDGNNDGIADGSQYNVVSAPDPNIDDKYITLEITGDVGTPNISNFTTNSTKGLKVINGSTFPVGGFGFNAHGGFEGSITVRIILDKVYDTTNWILKKNDGDSNDLINGPDATFSTVTIGGTEKTQFTYTIRDNGPFDLDGRDGYISDPVFPVVPGPIVPIVVPVPVPTPVQNTGSIVVPSSSYSYGTTNNLFSNTNVSARGQVLGASTTCGVYMNLNGDYLKVGHENNGVQVGLLKKFLNKNLNLNLEINNIYDEKTESAVKKFQSKYKNQILGPWQIDGATGIVYLTTVEYVNYLECPALGYNISRLSLLPIDKKR